MRKWLLACSLLSIARSGYAALEKVPRHRYENAWDLRAHPGHYPFISYLTFRNICDHVIEQHTEYFDPDLVKQGDTIYINIWYLDWFAQHIHDQIKHPYILVSCDVGAWLPDPQIKKLLYDPKLAAWFCRNIIFSYHPKLHQIPMGQDLGLFMVEPEVLNELLDAHAKKPQPKKQLLYMCHFPRALGDRDKIVTMFEDKPYCLSRNNSKQPWIEIKRPIFYDDLLSSQFVLSPLGLETDCVRTWEAFALDCIPIVEHTFLDPIYEGLPIVIVHDWEEIDQPFLEQKYQELKHLQSDKIYFDYWHTLIKDTQKKIRTGDLSCTQLEATKFSTQDLKDLQSVLSERLGGENPFLVYHGFLTSLRPTQLATVLPAYTYICLYDPWLDSEYFPALVGNNKHKITRLHADAQVNDMLALKFTAGIFLDLTYFRATLATDLNSHMNNHFRHSLKRDLEKLYDQLKPNALLCGNMANDAYVQKVLRKLFEEKNLKIETVGNIWFTYKS